MDESQVVIPLGIPDVRVLQTAINEQGTIVITIESTKEGVRCRRCGKQLKKLDGLGVWTALRHLSVFGHPTFLRYRPLRYQCKDCEGFPVTTQRLEWQHGTISMVS